MSLRARRPWGALLLAALLAVPTTMVAEAATSTSPSKSAPKTVSKGSAGTTSKAGSTRKRRARRAPPPGGVYARNAIVVDPVSGEVLYEKNASRAVPIASLSKLMTALVFLENDQNMDRSVEVTRAELYGGGRTQLRNLEKVKLDDLLHMSLMCSDNVATRVLVRESGLRSDDFLARMNRKAVELGLARTRFVEFTGLDERNVSTAADCARLLVAAAENRTIQHISTTRTHEFRSNRRPHMVANTNRLLYGRYEVLGGKTGYINEAGYCYATWLRTSQGRERVAVVLGAPTAATRFADVVRLMQRTTAPSVAAN